ncbi:hypothetical protein BJ508DRAFT_415099 [Ascobolus immersus RN42]|uniref:Uncharacterized protein n=1 Tax=Ascobolus immersus RN42 TaxID=1160509 RepID=A0A3N4I3Z9_ASCIM|nr:hypothetical protein BJ508DRAFT_415099 [Ascobolus immersus RN42]
MSSSSADRNFCKPQRFQEDWGKTWINSLGDEEGSVRKNYPSTVFHFVQDTFRSLDLPIH